MILTLLTMTVISFSLRYAPFAFSSWLQKWTFLEKLATTLPISILILLTAHNLQYTSCGIPEIIALLVVVITQVQFRSILLSMLLGVLCHQVLLRL